MSDATSKIDDERFMGAAIRLARGHQGLTSTNPSVACVIVAAPDDKPMIVGTGITALGGRPHAEPIALAEAGDMARGATAYVTLEPCTMCAAAISFARIERLYIGTEDIKGGGVINGVRFFDTSTCHHAPEIYSGFQATKSAKLLRDFFKQKR